MCVSVLSGGVEKLTQITRDKTHDEQYGREIHCWIWFRRALHTYPRVCKGDENRNLEFFQFPNIYFVPSA